MKMVMHHDSERLGLAFRVTLLLTLIMSVLSGQSEPRPAAQIAAQKLVPPAANRVPREIVTHGDRRVDDYFWLREKTNADVIAYLKAENAYTERFTKPLRGFQKALYQEMLGHLKETDVSAPVRRGEFF